MAYFQFTDEEKQRANETNLVEFLKSIGEKITPIGSEYRWDKHPSLSMKENKWFRHSTSEGGYPIQFCLNFLNMSYVESMKALLGNKLIISQEEIYTQEKKDIKRITQEEQKEPVLPEKNSNNKRLFAYLNKTRNLDVDIIEHFLKEKKLYESKEVSKTGREYNNVVFCGYDENNKILYAHKKSTLNFENAKNISYDVPNSDKRYSFNHIGKNENLYVFESPVDMLSYIALNKENWEDNNYISLGGVSDKALIQFLETNKNITKVILSLDNDNAGILSTSKILPKVLELTTPGRELTASINFPKFKDYNEDLKNKMNQTENKSSFKKNLYYKGDSKETYVFFDKISLITYMSLKRNIAKTNKDFTNHSYFFAETGEDLREFLKENKEKKYILCPTKSQSIKAKKSENYLNKNGFKSDIQGSNLESFATELMHNIKHKLYNKFQNQGEIQKASNQKFK